MQQAFILLSAVNAQTGQPVAANARVRCYTDERCGGTELSSDASAVECCAFAQLNGTSFQTIPEDGEQSPICLECVCEYNIILSEFNSNRVLPALAMHLCVQSLIILHRTV